MKCILVGHPQSQHIVQASSYLAHKYLGNNFDIQFLNYEGEKAGWSKFCADYLRTCNDTYVVFALDDYLLCSPVDLKVFQEALEQFDEHVICVKIHRSTPQEHEEYPVTTQYTIWNRTYLIALLDQTTDPWNFETKGSEILKASGQKSIHGYIALEYFTSSALSRRWEGIKWNGLKQEDREYIAVNFGI